MTSEASHILSFGFGSFEVRSAEFKLLSKVIDDKVIWASLASISVNALQEPSEVLFVDLIVCWIEVIDSLKACLSHVLL